MGAGLTRLYPHVSLRADCLMTELPDMSRIVIHRVTR